MTTPREASASKKVGSKKILALKNFWVQKVFLSKKFMCQKKFGSQKNFGFKMLFELCKACVLNLGHLLCLEPIEKFLVVVVGVESDYSFFGGPNLMFGFS